MYNVALEHLEEAALDAGLDEGAIRADYSGRGMYGKSCFGLVYDNPGELIHFALALVEIDEDAADWLTGYISSDSMGRSAIAYWRNVQVAENANA
jgi:hypothetical protein